MTTYAEYREAQEKLNASLYHDPEVRKVVQDYRLASHDCLDAYVKSGKSLLVDIKLYDPAIGDTKDAYMLSFGREIKAGSDGYVTVWAVPQEEDKRTFSTYVPLTVLEGSEV